MEKSLTKLVSLLKKATKVQNGLKKMNQLSFEILDFIRTKGQSTNRSIKLWLIKGTPKSVCEPVSSSKYFKSFIPFVNKSATFECCLSWINSTFFVVIFVVYFMKWDISKKTVLQRVISTRWVTWIIGFISYESYVGWAVPKALHGMAPLFDQQLWFPTKLGPIKKLTPSEFHFTET